MSETRMNEQRETGWHVHPVAGNVFRDDDCEFHDYDLMGPSVPALVVPVGEARETLARAFFDQAYRSQGWSWEEAGRQHQDWTREDFRGRADAVLAALGAW